MSQNDSDAGAVLESGIDGFRLLEAGVGGHAVGDPDVAAHYGVVADGDAAQDGGIGVDGDVVLDDGVSRDVEHIALLVVFEALGTEGDTLIEGDVVADDAGLADDDTRAVVDGEVLANLGTGVDVDAGLGMGLLGDDAGDDGHLHLVQAVGDAVVYHRVDHGVAEDHLAVGLRRRVVVEHGLHVGIQQALDLGQLVDEPQGQPLAGGQHVVLLALVAELQPSGYLLAQQAVELLHRHAYLVGAQLLVGLPAVEVVGEDDALDEADDGLDVAHGGQRCLQGGGHHAALVVGMLREHGHVAAECLVDRFLFHHTLVFVWMTGCKGTNF